MKKILPILLITISVGIFAKPSVAETCTGGVEFQGAVNGHTYCRSSTGMTWWATFAWCKKQGRELASMNQLCVDWAGATGNAACPNMVVGKDISGWSANPAGSSDAFYVNLSSGNFNGNLRTSNHYALCF